VRAGLRLSEVRRQDDACDGDHAHPRIPIRGRVGLELLEVHGQLAERGLLGQLALGRREGVLVDVDEPARQRPVAGEGLVRALDEEQGQGAVADREDREVDRHRERRVGAGVVVGRGTHGDTSIHPAARISSRAPATVSGATPACSPSTRRTVSPASAASRAEARTQWSVAIPHTSTAVRPGSRRTSRRARPSSVTPSKAEYAGTPWPLRTWTSTPVVSSSGAYSAPGVPWTQCAGHSSKWPAVLDSGSCQAREATTSADEGSLLARLLLRAATSGPPSTGRARP